MALIRTGSQPKTLATWHMAFAPGNPITVNVGDIVDVIWQNATIPTFSGCTQETLLKFDERDYVIRLTATSTSIGYTGDNFVMGYATY